MLLSPLEQTHASQPENIPLQIGNRERRETEMEGGRERKGEREWGGGRVGEVGGREGWREGGGMEGGREEEGERRRGRGTEMEKGEEYKWGTIMCNLNMFVPLSFSSLSSTFLRCLSWY